MQISKRPSKLFWRLFLGYALLVTAALVACVLLTLREFEQFYAEELTEHLKAQAIALRSQVRGQLDAEHMDRLDQIAKEVGGNEADSVRVTFVAVDGTVLGDSQADAAQMESHHDRPEIRTALTTGWGMSTRWSATVSRMLKYVAVRVGPVENPEGAVRVALAIRSIGEKTQAVHRIIWIIALIALVTTAVFAFGLARIWTLPIRRITRIAGRISRGDLSARARVRGSDEIARLARSLNEMRDHLSHQLATIEGQRQTLEALLNQLQEGIIVAGPDGKIVLANPAAVRFVDSDSAQRASAAAWVGRSVEQCVPQHNLQQLLLPGSSTQARETTEQDSQRAASVVSAARSVAEVRVELSTKSGSVVVLASASDITLPCTPTRQAKSDSDVQPRIGRILALTDITEIARTIQMKTDFAANASHELRTPLSAIRGAIETLLNINLSDDAESATRFLGVIDRHSARLEALVADLLALSRLEMPASEFRPMTVDWGRFGDELSAKWTDAVEKKSLHWEWIAPPDLREVTTDPQLITLVLDNLADNAIKFTAAGGHVTIRSKREHGNLIIEVTDDGCGIPAEDQQRVFERFYQVAQARSGTGSEQPEMRGTGLGLSIVRHAVAAMKGTVALNSEPGVGTRVAVAIPQPSQQ